ncbi:hypothetical protein AAHC03_017217 [Spirometra sp. Aus1]
MNEYTERSKVRTHDKYALKNALHVTDQGSLILLALGCTHLGIVINKQTMTVIDKRELTMEHAKPTEPSPIPKQHRSLYLYEIAAEVAEARKAFSIPPKISTSSALV